jgi:Zn-dependent M28 family amino/carboxypeptidase
MLLAAMLRSFRTLFLLTLLLGAGVVQATPLQDLTKLQSDTNAGRLAALREILKERGIPFEVQAFDGGSNVVVTFGAKSPRDIQGREIVVGAHYDAVKLKDGTLSRGMVDNGAGVIALAGLAEGLRGKPLRHPVRVVFFDQEEAGLLGSKAFVATRKPAEIAAAVNVDIVGYGDSLIFGGGKKEGNAPVYGALQKVCAARRLACLEFQSFPPGDDLSFDAAGVPNISVAFLPAVEAHQLWLLLNGGGEKSGLRKDFLPPILSSIHTPGDTLDKVDPATLERTPGVLLEIVLELDATLD